VGNQPRGLFLGVGGIGGGVPAADEGGLERGRQLRQLRDRQGEAAAILLPETVGATGEEHPVAGGNPVGEGVGQTGEEVASRQVVVETLRHLVHAIQDHQAAAVGQLLAEHLRGEAAGPGGRQPARQRIFQLLAGPGAVAGEAGRLAGPLAQAAEERKAIVQGVGQYLLEAVGGPHRVGRDAATGHGQGEPATEGGLAGPRGARHVQRMLAEAVEEEVVAVFPDREWDWLRDRARLIDGDGRHIDLAEADVVGLLRVQAEEVHALAGAAQPGEIVGAD